MEVFFQKWEGIGNDYVFLDHLKSRPFPADAALARALSDRNRGVGGDGLVEVLPSERADCRMEMRNSDGSASSMCGNALRCVAFLYHRHSGQDELAIETPSGIYRARILSAGEYEATVQVEMGAPIFASEAIPVNGAPESITMVVGQEQFQGRAVGMGNPHCVVFLDSVVAVEALDLVRLGPQLQRLPFFPESVNLEFVAVAADGALYQRTFERGSGETLACGSGACAAHVVGVLENRVPVENTVRLRGGDLILRYDPSATNPGVTMTGPARLAFSGKFYVASPPRDR